MKERIQQRLREVEAEHGFRILYACESGSRAWGVLRLASNCTSCHGPGMGGAPRALHVRRRRPGQRAPPLRPRVRHGCVRRFGEVYEGGGGFVVFGGE